MEFLKSKWGIALIIAVVVIAFLLYKKNNPLTKALGMDNYDNLFGSKKRKAVANNLNDLTSRIDGIEVKVEGLIQQVQMMGLAKAGE